MSPFAVGGGTPPYEAALEAKRASLRKVLKKEFLRQGYHPRNYGETLGRPGFDTALARWHAIHYTYPEITKRNWRNGTGFALMVIVPFFFLYNKLTSDTVSQRQNRNSIEKNLKKLLISRWIMRWDAEKTGWLSMATNANPDGSFSKNTFSQTFKLKQ